MMAMNPALPSAIVARPANSATETAADVTVNHRGTTACRRPATVTEAMRTEMGNHIITKLMLEKSSSAPAT
jgi:hypothetical protein